MNTTERKIRKSGYGDYFAIDLVNGNDIIETPLYLRKNEEREIKLVWEYSIFNSSGEHPQREMVKAFIKFDGDKVFMCYDPKVCHSGNDKFWFEPTKYELLSKTITHFK